MLILCVGGTQLVLFGDSPGEAGFNPPGGIERCFKERGEQVFVGVAGSLLYFGAMANFIFNGCGSINIDNLLVKGVYYFVFSFIQQYVLCGFL